MRTAGFTLTELLMVCALIALLLVLATPHYRSVLGHKQTHSDVQHLLNALHFARTQALLHGHTVTLCPLQQLDQCGQDWSYGFLVFQDMHSNGLFSTGDRLLSSHVFQDKPSVSLHVFPAGSEHHLQFAANGYPRVQNGSFYYQSDQSAELRIVFNQAGRAYIQAAE